jgi:TonB-dependent starch-binding outer membrane protein SusC
MNIALVLSKAARFAMFVVLLGSVASAVASAQASGVISGTVTDADNRPLPGATVRLASADGSVQRSIVTNANGRYEIAGLATGAYTVTAELVGFRAQVKKQHVTGGRREVWLVMEPGELRETLPGPARPPARIIPLSPQR